MLNIKRRYDYTKAYYVGTIGVGVRLSQVMYNQIRKDISHITIETIVFDAL